MSPSAATEVVRSSNGGQQTATSPTNGLNNNNKAAANNNNMAKKKSGLSLGNLKNKFMGGGSSSSKTYCKGCRKKCSGEVLRVNEFYFHTGCFKCAACGKSLAHGGFFSKDQNYYCSPCYQTNYGTKCARCNKYVEGEVVTALGKTYHQSCFTCAGCKKPFPTGERVTFTGKACLCQSCVQAGKDLDDCLEDIKDLAASLNGGGQNNNKNSHNNSQYKSNNNRVISEANNGGFVPDDACAGCRQELKDGQALMALDKQYHVWCFKCRACNTLLHGEYMGKDGHPYCERDYQAQFGVKCTYCRRFISGKVLQAGDNNHFHPTCARCTKCGEPFGDGEEMFLQGAAIWHPRCGPGPDESSAAVVSNGFNGNDVNDGASMASNFYSRASSPGGGLRSGYDRFSRSTMHVEGRGHPGYGGPSGGLYSSSSTYSLRRPIEPGDRIGSLASINHFHVPAHLRRGSSSSRAANAIPPSASGTPLPGGPSHSMAASVMAGNISESMANSMSSSQFGVSRPISCPPKPGYTHSARQAATLPPGLSGTIPPASSATTPQHFHIPRGSYRSGSRADMNSDAISQQSFNNRYGSRSSNVGLVHAGAGRPYNIPATPVKYNFSGEHKIYPLHVIMTNNYKVPPDLDRCNLEKHLSDADFEIAFAMGRRDFYSMPLWRRNDMKKRVHLF